MKFGAEARKAWAGALVGLISASAVLFLGTDFLEDPAIRDILITVVMAIMGYVATYMVPNKEPEGKATVVIHRTEPPPYNPGDGGLT